MHGVPVFRGTRVPVQTLFGYLTGGETREDFLEGFPTVSRDLALEALEEAKQLLLARAWCVFSSSSASTNVCGFSFPAMTARPPVSPIWRA